MRVSNTVTPVEVHLDELVDQRTSSSSKYKLTVVRRGTSWNGTESTQVVDHQGNLLFHWAFPALSSWRNESGTYKYYVNGVAKATLNWKFPNAGYPQHRIGNILESDIITVPIARGNSRQGQITITAGVKQSGVWKDCMVRATLSTTRIADVSKVLFTIKEELEPTRRLVLTAEYVNPEDYYSSKILKGNTLIASGQNLVEIPITSDMFYTTQTYTLQVVGADNVVYETKSVSIAIEPIGVGVVVKDQNLPRELDGIFYKDDNGIIQEISEVWFRQSNSIEKTVK